MERGFEQLERLILDGKMQQVLDGKMQRKESCVKEREGERGRESVHVSEE